MSESLNDKFQNKLQIKARLLSAIVNLQANFQDKSFVEAEVSELLAIQDKKSVLDVLQKEYLKENSETRDYTIVFMLQELVPQEDSEKAFFEVLANPRISDSLKTKVVSFLREIGKHINYEQYVAYFENPDELIDSDTEKLLENAKINPEAQIDFLDFMAALPTSEKDILLNSLVLDYDGDNLTNILIPVILANPYSEISQLAIKAIGESKSKLAYSVLVWLKENIDDLQIKAGVQKSLNILKLSGIKQDYTKEYYKKLLQDSPVYHCSVSFPDGHGNIGLIFSRRNGADFVQMFATVFNDIDGIVDCFGFNQITDAEFERIVTKFHQNNDVVGIDSTLCKYLLDNAEKITRLKYQEVPYEYIAWKSITNDIEYVDLDLRSDGVPVELSDFLLKQVEEQNYFDKWFFVDGDNAVFDKIVSEIVENKIQLADEFENRLNNASAFIFDESVLSIINNRLMLTAYFANVDGREVVSDIIYSLINPGEIKDKFKTTYLKKSLYQYFLAQKDRYESIKNATSIFARKSNKDLNNIDIKYIQACIDEIEKSWVRDE